MQTLKLKSELRYYAILIVSVCLGGLQRALGTVKYKISWQQPRVISISHCMSAMSSPYWIPKLKERPLSEILTFL